MPTHGIIDNRNDVDSEVMRRLLEREGVADFSLCVI